MDELGFSDRGRVMIERPKGEPTPLTKLMHRLAPIVDDIVAGRNAVAIANDYELHGCTVGFIRKAIGIKRQGTRKVPESRIEAVMQYSLTHTIQETAEHFGISKSTVCSDIRRACGVTRCTTCMRRCKSRAT